MLCPSTKHRETARIGGDGLRLWEELCRLEAAERRYNVHKSDERRENGQNIKQVTTNTNLCFLHFVLEESVGEFHVLDPIIHLWSTWPPLTARFVFGRVRRCAL